MNNTFKNILVPYNGCPGSQKAFKKAVSLAELAGAKITILTCLEERATFGFFKTKTNKQEYEKEQNLVAHEHKKLEKYAKEQNVSPIFKIVKSRMASNTILEFAEEHDIDLIVMGMKKRLGYEKMHYPSTIEDIFKNFKKAILVLN